MIPPPLGNGSFNKSFGARTMDRQTASVVDESNHMKIRTAIMVAGMIILPLAAVVGVKWPHFVEAGKQISRSNTGRDAERGKSGPPTGSPTAQTASPKMAHDSHVIPVGATSVVSTPDDASPLTTDSSSPANTDIHATSRATADSAAPSPISRTTTSDDPYTEIQQRLRAMGATYYALETWGTQGEAYRFQCRMAAGHNPNYNRHFEATDVDPLRAMRTVLDDIEAWKSGRLP
jgi:hypothetical protein